MEITPGTSLTNCLRVLAAMAAAMLLVCPGGSLAGKSFVDNEVVIIGRNFVKSTPYDDGVVLESKRGRFAPVKFHGVEGTAAMLFLYNRITRDMGVDLLLQTYPEHIDRRQAEEAIDEVLRFYRDNDLIFQSRFVEKPATKVGIHRYKI